MQWSTVKQAATTLLTRKKLPELYSQRLDFEFSEIEKQGSESLWMGYVSTNAKFASNPKKLLLPYLLGMVTEDPIKSSDFVATSTNYKYIVKASEDLGRLPDGIYRDSDFPDIDIDCLPHARDHIKAYAIEQYGNGVSDGYGTVCSVGTWNTYKFKSALIDAAKAMAVCDKSIVFALTTELPEDVDGMKDNGESICQGMISVDGEEKQCKTKHSQAKCPSCGSRETEDPTIGALLEEYENLAAFENLYPHLVADAVRLVGKVRHMGKHAGAVIIADRPLYGNVPLFKKKSDDQWTSMWTEGRNTQLSKLGYVKWDILGLKNLHYIFHCCKLIEKNHGVSFGATLEGLDESDPENDIAGVYWINGEKHIMSLNDPKALAMADAQRTDAIFQFDTDLAKKILANGVRSFKDLLLYNAMGHPGPMQCIPEAVANRDDTTQAWKKSTHPDVLKILLDTYGVIVYQEQLQRLWQEIAGFTAPEAQAARKAVAKKWKEKLKPIRQKWLDGATPILGKDLSVIMADKMETFGRYAFNLSHAVCYCLTAYRCLWFKAYYPAEWWASVMSHCGDPDKLIRFMNVARSEGVQIGSLDIHNLDVDFTVVDGIIVPGLIGIKGIGDVAAEKLKGICTAQTVEEFVEAKGVNKTVMERLIKLGAFNKLPGHENRKVTWAWYNYKCVKDAKPIRDMINKRVLENAGWNEKTIADERARQEAEYRTLYPKRKVIPSKILKWAPVAAPTMQDVASLITTDFSINELLEFEREYLGYYIHSPLDSFVHGQRGVMTIADAKTKCLDNGTAIIEAVIMAVRTSKTRNDNMMYRLVLNDGLEDAILVMWEDNYKMHDERTIQRGVGVMVCVNYSEAYNSFSVARGTVLMRLKKNDSSEIPLEMELAGIASE